MKAIYAKFSDGRMVLRAAFDQMDQTQLEEIVQNITNEMPGAEVAIVEDAMKSVEDIINGHLRPLILMEDIGSARKANGLEDFRENPNINNQYSLFLAGMAVLAYNVDKTDGDTFADEPDFGVNYRQWCFVRKTMIMAMSAEELEKELPEWNKELVNWNVKFQALVDILLTARHEQMLAMMAAAEQQQAPVALEEAAIDQALVDGTDESMDGGDFGVSNPVDAEFVEVDSLEAPAPDESTTNATLTA